MDLNKAKSEDLNFFDRLRSKLRDLHGIQLLNSQEHYLSPSESRRDSNPEILLPWIKKREMG